MTLDASLHKRVHELAQRLGDRRMARLESHRQRFQPWGVRCSSGAGLIQHLVGLVASGTISAVERALNVSRQMLQEMGREPTPEELAVRMEMPEDKVRKVLKIAKEPISMETPIGDDEDSHLGDFIEDTSVASPIDQATMESLRETTHAVLAQLTPREAKVLRMRFGIDMNTDHTLEEVGKQFDVTRERIRQIEAKALRKLRHPSRSEQLRSFLMDD